MNKIYLLFVCCFMNLAAFATGTTYYPVSVSAPYGGTAQTVCQNGTNAAASVTYSVCGTSIPAGGTLSVTATWYLNGVPVYPDPTVHNITTTTGTISLPAGAFAYSSYGTFTAGSGLANSGLYCSLSWTTGGSSVCNPGVDSAAGVTTNITVNETPTAINGVASACTGTSSMLSDVVATGGTPVWSSSNTTIASVNFSTGTVTANTAGTATITYKLGSGCYATTVFTSNQTPAAISGVFSVCSGTLHILTDVTTGGTWTSSYDTVATVGSGTGNLVASLDSGVAFGVTTISYTLAAGCSTSTTVTVNESPSIITGPGVVCSGSTISLSDSVSGGVWTSSNAAIASVNFTTGVVTGVGTSGNARISYELNSGCYATTGLITVNPLPAAITGVQNVCVNSLTSLSDLTTAGIWSASNSDIVIGSGSGFVTGTGATAGIDTMYYTLNTGCYKSIAVTVNQLPAASTGADSVCQGSTTMLTDSPTGGTWSSSVVSVATIATSGVVTGVASGITTITYKLGTGCYGTTLFTVNGLPSTISGVNSLCEGSNTALSDITFGGAWSSSNSGVAGIGTGTGIVGGNGQGTATISYTLLMTGCARSIIMTVNTTPSISGATAVCMGTQTQLTDNVAGGTWSSGNTAVATISATGLVSGISGGIATISYKVSTGCMTTYEITVNSNPVAITGTTHVCAGLITALTDATTLGTWSSSNTGTATVDASGNVLGVSAGTVTISYITSATSCSTTTRVTVNALPAGISGLSSVCAGSTLSLSDATTGGTWSSTNIAVGTISTTGVVAGLSQGTDIINYTITATGCVNSSTITVNPLPAVITGTPDVCAGLITSLADDTTGGVWSSSNTAKAIVDGAGNVTGVSVGTASITYALTATTGCQTKINVTVNALPGAINGLNLVCVNSTISLSDITTGGAWSSGITTVAMVSSTGIVTGTGAGITGITYTSGAGCIATTMITVNEIPSVIMGAESVCASSTTALSNYISGGIWSSSSTTVAIIGNSTGVATGMNAGTSTIAYILGSGCKTTAVLTVDPLPAAITGLTNVCTGLTITLDDATAGGTWMSSNGGVATIGSGSGIITGETAGTVSMTFSLATGCMRTTVINVNPLPVGIIGIPDVCMAGTTALTDPTPGGVWTSSSAATAIVGTSSGIVTGESPGSVNITYTLSTGCDTTVTVTVNPLPGIISGPTSVCQGQNITLSDGAFVGSWISSNTTVATVGSNTGIVTGVAAGTAIVTFMLNTTGCFKTVTITVRQLPAPITGDTVICQTPTSGLADLTSGGTWTSSNIGVATINITSGLMTPGVSGTSTITYTLSTGCYNTQGVTVNPNPSVISGATNVCVGSTTALTDATTGGTWVSSNATFATVNETTGVVTGVLAGSVDITYILSTGCIATAPLVVNPLPSPITGNTYVCTGVTTTLHDVTGGGTWSSSNISVAQVTEMGGVVTGFNAGTTIISYIPGTGCNTSIVVTVNPTPSPIIGQLFVCTGQTDTLTDASTGGEWTSSHSSIASAGTLTGVITGVSAGNSTITYTLGTGCYTTNLLTVYATPAPISGPANVCQGTNFGITLSDATPGGVWSSAETIVATIGAETGNVIGQSISGTDSIIYTIAGVCSAYQIINVNQTPVITGPSGICTGPLNSDTLIGSISAGTWTSSNTGIATVDITSGIVTGISNGSVNISYTLGTGCYDYVSETVNTTPSVITGPLNVCPKLSIALSDATPLGNWSSSDPSIAAVSTSGIVTGIAYSGGSAVISYIVGTGCGIATTINVNPAPLDISGSLIVCDGYTSTLSDISPDGIWTSSNTTVAPVGISSGVVSGVSIGTANITYELLSTGCLASSTVTVNPDPSPISGISNVCAGTTITLSDASPLGTWSSSNMAVATIGSSTGIINGIDSGYTTITYTMSTGCFATYLVRGNLTPDAIAGPTSVCAGSMIALSDATPFGTWSSSNTAVAAIYAATGSVQGLSSGTTVITYLLGTGCLVYQNITVNALPAAITGPSIVCVGSTIFLSDSTAGGVWSITNNTYGTVDISGNVTGIAAGNDTVIYTLFTGCVATQFLTVSPVLTPVSGMNVLCVGSVDSLTSAPPGGIWSSSNILVATVGSGTGYATGVSAGLVTITYTSLSSCNVVATITVNPVPAPISGVNNLCPGLTTTLFDVTGGGVWSSTNTVAATIGSTGTLTSSSVPGTTTISYTISDGCAATLAFSVNPLPYIGPVDGTKSFCVNATSALSDSAAGGAWTSTNTSIATIDASSGIATGVAAGTVVISYHVTEHCGLDSTSTVIQINPLPYAAPISGSPRFCLNSSTLLSDSTAGGVWSSSDTAVASINATSGLAYGVSAGFTTISYTYTNSCGSYSAMLQASVNVLFSFAAITTFPDTPMCSQTFNQNFGALLPEPAGISYSWSVTAGDSVVGIGAYGQYAIISFNNPGRAVVTLSAEILSSGCVIADSFVTTIGSAVSSDPGVQYYLSEFACTDNTQDSYQWGYDDVITLDSTILVGEVNQTYYNAHPDTLGKNYWVMTTKNGCSQKAYYTFNITPTAVSNVTTANTEILLFPNPADSKVNIVVKGLNSTDVINVKLMDMFGREIQTTSLVNGKGVLQVSELPSGVYSVLFLNNDVKMGARTFVKN